MLKKTILICFVIASNSCFSAGAAKGSSIGIQAEVVYQSCLKRLKNEMLGCTSGCGLLLQSCSGEKVAFLSDKSNELYGELMKFDLCRDTAEKLHKNVDASMEQMSQLSFVEESGSEFESLSLSYLYDSLSILKKGCTKK